MTVEGTKKIVSVGKLEKQMQNWFISLAKPIDLRCTNISIPSSRFIGADVVSAAVEIKLFAAMQSASQRKTLGINDVFRYAPQKTTP